MELRRCTFQTHNDSLVLHISHWPPRYLYLNEVRWKMVASMDTIDNNSNNVDKGSASFCGLLAASLTTNSSDELSAEHRKPQKCMTEGVNAVERNPDNCEDVSKFISMALDDSTFFSI
jgi:hypothetical protein